MRPSKRKPDQPREIKFTRNYTKHAAGSVLAEFGDTKVICSATIATGVPKFLKGSNQAWLTAEYGMLPTSTNSRMQREASRGKQGGRTLEIQRLIGRSLRACIDCDVIQADGGTRTASISGAWVALIDALKHDAQSNKKIHKNNLKMPFPVHTQITAISAGIYKDLAILDLDYLEDSDAETDMNIVMDNQGNFIEIQGTAEGKPFSSSELNRLLELGQKGGKEIIKEQLKSLGIKSFKDLCI